MDDIVLLARTRWQLRRAIAALHEEIAPLGLHLHRVKRFIGRTAQGFDFLGYRIRAGARLRPSAEGLRRLRERARRLHEREGDRHRLRQYVLRWQRWHFGGLDGIVSRKYAGRRRRTQLAACADTPRTPASVLLLNVAPRSLHEQAGTGVTRTRGGSLFKKPARAERHRCGYRSVNQPVWEPTSISVRVVSHDQHNNTYHATSYNTTRAHHTASCID